MGASGSTVLTLALFCSMNGMRDRLEEAERKIMAARRWAVDHDSTTYGNAPDWLRQRAAAYQELVDDYDLDLAEVKFLTSDDPHYLQPEPIKTPNAVS